MRRTIPVLSAATTVLALAAVASCTTTSRADTPTPTPHPPVVLAAEPGQACGTVQLAITGTPMEVWRAITLTPTAGEDVDPHAWVRQTREPALRVDVIDPDGRAVTYRALGFDTTVTYSAPVVTEKCSTTPGSGASSPLEASTSPDPDESAGATPGPTPSTTAAASPTAAATATPDAPAEPEREGGLAATGAGR